MTFMQSFEGMLLLTLICVRINSSIHVLKLEDWHTDIIMYHGVAEVDERRVVCAVVMALRESGANDHP